MIEVAAAAGLSVDGDVAAEEAGMRKLLLHRTSDLRWPYRLKGKMSGVTLYATTEHPV
jgi:hypothetical protein